MDVHHDHHPVDISDHALKVLSYVAIAVVVLCLVAAALNTSGSIGRISGHQKISFVADRVLH